MDGLAKEEELSVPRLSLGGSSIRPKRDEWGEGAVTCLLEAYESKWILRNRAKLKGQDWEDVARQVSSRADSAGSAKTATQCKNKIESMKKRYRNEVAAGSGSRWPLFAKLDGLVRCRGSTMSTALVMIDEKPTACEPVEAGSGAGAQASQSPEPNGIAGAEAVAQEYPIGEGLQPTETNKDQDAPSCDSSKENQEDRKRKKEKRKRAMDDGWVAVESFQWLAEVILRVEQTRIETMREVEKIRAEAEAKKGEMDLKRTEIIANTQLQIAKLFARSRDKVISSPIIGRD